jgi:broad specificity phosphatase PhoE
MQLFVITHSFCLFVKVKWIQFKGRARRNLDELYAGVCDGLTYQEIKEKFPEEFARRQENKLTYRYPRGKDENRTCN